jgi:hypothetical protein
VTKKKKETWADPEKKGSGATAGKTIKDKAFAGAAQEFGREIVPAGKRVGELTTRIFNLFFDRIEIWVKEREQMKQRVGEELAKKLESVDPEKIVAPNPRIAVPALQGLSLSMDDAEIREMFLNLVAADMNSDSKGSTHPGYAAIIKEMTSVEAKVVAVLKAAPQIRFSLRIVGGRAWREVGHEFSFSLAGVSIGGLLKATSNLERLGVCEIQYDYYPSRDEYVTTAKAIEDKYGQLKEDIKRPDVEAELGLGENLQLGINQHGLYLTPFGVDFAQLCLK